MRDIRADLQERRNAVLKEIQDLEAQVRARRNSLQHVDGLIAIEEEHWGKPEQKDLVTEQQRQEQRSGELDFGAFVRNLLSDGKALSTAEIKDRAIGSGFQFSPGTEGRAVNFRLIGLERFGHLNRDADGNWRLGTTN
jgi:hypothetical protein